MTAQAIDGTPLHSTSTINNTAMMSADISDALIIREKVGIATTLAFLVGIVQVECERSTLP
jgi:hypothetical protein